MTTPKLVTIDTELNTEYNIKEYQRAAASFKRHADYAHDAEIFLELAERAKEHGYIVNGKDIIHFQEAKQPEKLQNIYFTTDSQYKASFLKPQPGRPYILNQFHWFIDKHNSGLVYDINELADAIQKQYEDLLDLELNFDLSDVEFLALVAPIPFNKLNEDGIIYYAYTLYPVEKVDIPQ